MGYSLVLTHDIDVLSCKELPWHGKTLWGFAYRCLKAAMSQSVKRFGIAERLYLTALCMGMPLVKMGLMPDPWAESLKVMLDIEKRHGVRSTLFFIPFPGCPGKRPDGKPAPPNRAAHYRLRNLGQFLRDLEADGWEVGVHGINAHLSLRAAKEELEEVKVLTGKEKIGIRMHWLYHCGQKTWDILAQAGYFYDATFGWNDRIGFPENRLHPFHPFANKHFRVLPLNIQDGALFEYAGLSESEAWHQVNGLLDKASEIGATVTVLWHNNSFVAPRYWGAVYEWIIERALSDGAQIFRAIDAVEMQYRDAE